MWEVMFKFVPFAASVSWGIGLQHDIAASAPEILHVAFRDRFEERSLQVNTIKPSHHDSLVSPC